MFIGFFALCSAPLTKVGFGTCLFFSRAYPPRREHPHVVMMCERDSGLSMATDCCQQKFECRNKFSIVDIKFMLRPEHRIQFLWLQKAYCPLQLYVWRPLYRFIFIAYEMRWQIPTKSQWNIWILIFEYNKHCILIWVSRQCLSSDYFVIFSHGHLQQA